MPEDNTNTKSFVRNFFSMYRDGFRNLSKYGKRLWIIILIKLFIMFVILKLFFFKDFLSIRFSNDKEKSDYVINVLTNNKN